MILSNCALFCKAFNCFAGLYVPFWLIYSGHILLPLDYSVHYYCKLINVIPLAKRLF